MAVSLSKLVAVFSNAADELRARLSANSGDTIPALSLKTFRLTLSTPVHLKHDLTETPNAHVEVEKAGLFRSHSVLRIEIDPGADAEAQSQC